MHESTIRAQERERLRTRARGTVCEVCGRLEHDDYEDRLRAASAARDVVLAQLGRYERTFGPLPGEE